MSSRWTDDIDALSKRLESLQITNKASEKIYEQSDKEMFAKPAPVMMNNNKQAVMPKNMVPDSEWFNEDRTKFEDWWKRMWLFLKSDKVMETDNRIMAILAHLRRGVANIYIQRKLDKLDKELET